MDVRIYQEEGRMLEGFKQWRLKRRILKTATESLAEHKGIAGKGWDATASMTPAARATLAQEVRTWLVEQLPYTATPHGLSRYHVALGYSCMHGQERTYLGQDPFTPFNRADALQTFDQVHEHICTINLTRFPTMTTLEAYLLSYGDLLKPLYDEA
jgi:hypothetical protein